MPDSAETETTREWGDFITKAKELYTIDPACVSPHI